MIELVESFPLAMKVLWRDKKALLFALVPIFIGLTLFLLGGGWVISTAIPFGQNYIQAHLTGAYEGVATFFFGALVIGLVLVAVSWLFVLVVGVIAGPFNDFLSERVEVYLRTNESIPVPISGGYSGIAYFIQGWINEVKKLFLIIFLSIIALAIGLIPLLAPISLALSGLVMAINFLNYSWTRHNFGLGDVSRDVRKNLIPYAISGALWGFMITIPIINILALPLGVTYFTILWTKLNHQKK